jgi:hypothetical protein
MTLGEFEQLVRDNAASIARTDLIESRYRARYSTENGESNLIGTAEWSVRASQSGGARLELTGLQLPLRLAKWSDGQDAVVYKNPGNPHPILFVPDGGDRTLNLEWSARGIAEPGEVRFDLRVPATPLATLELTLPINVQPVLPQADTLLTGPFAGADGTQLWRISFGGQSLLELVLHRTGDSPTPLFVRTNSVLRLIGSDAGMRSEFQVESSRAGFAEFAIEHDAQLTISGVSVNNLAAWSIEPGKAANRLLVRLREPTRSATVVVTGSAPIALGPSRWTSPRAWVVGGVRLSEQLRIVVGPTLWLNDWQPGAYRVVRGAVSPSRNYEIDAELGNALDGERPIVAPAFVLTPRNEMAPVVQRSEWAIGPTEQSWTVHTALRSSEIKQRTWRFRAPDDWVVEDASVGGHAVPWTLVDTSPRELLVELPDGSPGSNDEVVVRLSRRMPVVNHSLRLPDLMPVGFGPRSGTMTIQVHPSLEVTRSTAMPGRVPEPAPAETGNSIELFPELLKGELTVRGLGAQARTQLACDVVAGKPNEVQCQLTIVPIDRPLSELTLWTAANVANPWPWFDENGRRVADAIARPGLPLAVRLLGRLPLPSLAATADWIANSIGHWWSVRLPRPINRIVRLTSVCRNSDASSAIAPVPWVVGMPFEGLLIVPPSLGGAHYDNRMVADEVAADQFRNYRFGNEVSRDQAAMAVSGSIAKIRLLTQVDAEGNAHVKFQFEVRSWSTGLVTLDLPEEVNSASVEVARRPVASEGAKLVGRSLQIQVPNRDEWTPVIVRYDLRPRIGFLQGHIRSEAPVGPFPASQVERAWNVDSSWDVVPPNGSSHLNVSSSIPLPNVGVLPGVQGDLGNTLSDPGSNAGWQVFHGGDELHLLRRQRCELVGWGAAFLLALMVMLIPPARLRACVLVLSTLLAVVILEQQLYLADYFARPFIFCLPLAALSRFLLDRKSQSAQLLKNGLSVAIAIAPVGLLLFGAAWSHAQIGPADEVFELPGDDGRPAAILVPQVLVEKLRHGPEVVIAEMALEGRRGQGVARFKARYRVFAFSAGPNALTLPTGGIRIRSAMLDGGEPSEIAVVGNSLHIPIVGAGAHTLELNFTVAVEGTASEREVKIPVPEAPIARLAFEVASPGSRLRAVNWRGASTVATTPNSQKLDLDLGAIANLIIRWQDAADVKSNSRVTAACLWRIGAGSNLLSSAFDYRIANSALSELRLAILAGMDVYRLTLRPDVVSAGSPRVAIRDWRLQSGGENGGRILVVELAAPVTGRLVLRLDLVASDSTANRRSFEFPRPLQVTEVDQYAAVVSPATGEEGIAGVDGLAESSGEDFSQNIWKAIDGTALSTKVGRAFRVVGPRPQITFSPLPSAPAKMAVESVNWWFHAGDLIGAGETRWTGTGLSLLEWDFPADTRVVELSARNLLRWSQRAGRVQAWFDRPVADPIVLWRAWRTPQIREDGRFDITAPGHPSARTDVVTSHVSALDGWIIEPESAGTKVDWLPAQSPGEVAWKCAGGRTATVHVTGPAGVRQLSARIQCRVKHDRILMESVIDLRQLPATRAHVVSLDVRTNAGAEVQVSAAPPLIVRPRPSADNVHRWTVFVPKGAADSAQVNVVSSGATSIPELRVRLGPTSPLALQQTISIDEKRLRLVDSFGLSRSKPNEWQTDNDSWWAGIALVETEPPARAGQQPPETAAETPHASGPVWHFLAAIGLGIVILTLACINLKGTEPERVAGLGAIAALVFGVAGALFWLMPVAILAWRATHLTRRLRFPKLSR